MGFELPNYLYHVFMKYAEDELKKGEKIMERVKRLEEEGYKVFFISDLMGCELKRQMLKKFPQFRIMITLSPAVWQGVAIHEFIQELFLKYGDGWETEVPIEYRIEEPKKIALLGRIDLINKNKRHIIELKTTRVAPDEPFKHHEAQVLLYKSIMEKITGDEYTAELIYVTRDGVKTFSYHVGMHLDLTYNKIVDLISDLVEDWQCKYCPFRDICKILGVKRVLEPDV